LGRGATVKFLWSSSAPPTPNVIKGPTSLPVVVDWLPSLVNIANRLILCWSGMAVTEYNGPVHTREEKSCKVYKFTFSSSAFAFSSSLAFFSASFFSFSFFFSSSFFSFSKRFALNETLVYFYLYRSKCLREIRASFTHLFIKLL